MAKSGIVFRKSLVLFPGRAYMVFSDYSVFGAAFSGNVSDAGEGTETEKNNIASFAGL